MSGNQLFQTILKVFGLLFLRDLIMLVVPFIINLFGVIQGSSHISMDIFESIVVLIGFSIPCMLCYLLLFRTEFLVEKLHLSRGLENVIIERALHRSTILRIAFLILGGWLVANEIPGLVQQYFYQKKMQIGAFNGSNVNYVYLVSPLIKIAIGMVLIVNQRTLVNWIERKRK